MHAVIKQTSSLLLRMTGKEKQVLFYMASDTANIIKDSNLK